MLTKNLLFCAQGGSTFRNSKRKQLNLQHNKLNKMKSPKFLFALITTFLLTFFLNRPITIGDTPIPALGKFLNPFTGFWQNATATDDIPSRDINIPQLTDEVDVIYDDKLVPHIFAQNTLDAMMVQGYIEAQHRLWQMDISTRASSGRLSEIMGKRTLRMDKIKRREGMVYAAKRAIATWKKHPKDFALVEAYTAGINAYVNQLRPKDYPLEFKLIGYQPELWTPLKSAIFLKAMAEDLSKREEDIESTNALATFGREIFDFIYPERNPKDDPIIPPSTDYDFTPITIETTEQKEVLGSIFHEPHEKPDKHIGSNNWAIHGSKTASGNPILCNDPHLGLSLPAIWFELQIHTPDLNVYGVSLPGVPGITIGFNEKIAWGFTNVGHDVLDWYKIKWTDETKTSYYLDGEIKKADLVLETYKVKSQPDVIDTVRYTHWGPVVHESKKHPYQDLAMHWMAHESEGNELNALYNLNNSKNFDDYFSGLKGHHNPAQNMAFASKDGDIAIKIQGRLPLKEKEQGRFVRDGSMKASGWQGYIPYEQTPWVKNPERGFVSSANQFSADSKYPYYYNGGFEENRGRILNRKLEQMSKITPKDMMALQNDNYSLKAEEALPLLLQQLEGMSMDDLQKEAFNILKQWDYNYDKASNAPHLFNNFYSAFYRATWDEIYAVRKDDHPMLFPDSWRTIALLKDDPQNIFFDVKETEEKETAKEIVQKSFSTMTENYKKWKTEGKITWGDFRNVRVPHVGRLPGLGRSKIPVSGWGDVLNATRGAFGPSWRMVVEVGDEIKAWGVYPAGQSGNPGSKYYDNMIDNWAKGEYYELLFMKNAQEQNDRIISKQKFK